LWLPRDVSGGGRSLDNVTEDVVPLEGTTTDSMDDVLSMEDIEEAPIEEAEDTGANSCVEMEGIDANDIHDNDVMDVINASNAKDASDTRDASDAGDASDAYRNNMNNKSKTSEQVTSENLNINTSEMERTNLEMERMLRCDPDSATQMLQNDCERENPINPNQNTSGRGRQGCRSWGVNWVPMYIHVRYL
jgi:hypothetical protein